MCQWEGDGLTGVSWIPSALYFHGCGWCTPVGKMMQDLPVLTLQVELGRGWRQGVLWLHGKPHQGYGWIPAPGPGPAPKHQSCRTCEAVAGAPAGEDEWVLGSHLCLPPWPLPLCFLPVAQSKLLSQSSRSRKFSVWRVRSECCSC